MFGIRGYKSYQKAVKELEDFQETKQDIVYLINHVIDEKKEKEEEKKRNEAQKELFKKELIERVSTYLLDLPMGEYELKYNDVFKTKVDFNEISINILENDKRSIKDKLTDSNRKRIAIWRVRNAYSESIPLWEINDILKFHNSLENIMLLIGKKYGYKSSKTNGDSCECEILEEKPVSLIP